MELEALLQIKNIEKRIKKAIVWIGSQERRNPEAMMPFCEQVILDAMSLKNDVYKAEGLLCKGRVYLYTSKLDECIKLFQSAYEITRNMNQPLINTQILTSLGHAYAEYNMHDEALFYCLEGFKIANNNQIIRYQAIINNNIGEIYRRLKSFDEAFKHYEDAEVVIKSHPGVELSDVLCAVQINIAQIKISQMELNEAESIVLFVLRALKDDNLRTKAYVYHSLGKIYYMKQDYEQAIKYYQMSEEFFEINGNKIYHVFMLIDMAKVYVEIHNSEKELEVLMNALALANAVNGTHLKSKTTSALANFHERHENFKEALQFYKAFHDTDLASEKIIIEQRMGIVKARSEMERAFLEAERYKSASKAYKEKSEALVLANHRIAMISEVGRRITSLQNVQAIYDLIYGAFMPLVHHDVFILSVYDPHTEQLNFEVVADREGREEVKSVSVHATNSMLAWSFNNKEEVCSDNILNDYPKYISDFLPRIRCGITRSVIYIPLLASEKAIGVLSIQSKQEADYDLKQIELVRALAAYLAIAISNAMKSESLQQEILERSVAQMKLEKANALLKELSEKDGLTGVNNRRRIDTYISDLKQMANYPIHVMMIDVDYFKTYNDTYGHLKGDDVLKSMALLLQNQFEQQGGFLGRYGGEEFIGIFINQKTENILKFGNKLVKRVKELNIPHRESVYKVLTISIGISSNEGDLNYIEELIHHSDLALYSSKAKGRNRVTMD